MTSLATVFRFILLPSLVLVAAIAHSEPEESFKARYKLQINVGSESRSVESRVHVRDRGVVPVEIGNYRAEIKVSRTDPGYYEAQFQLLEDANGTWDRLNLATVSFSGVDGETVWFQWRILEIDVRLEFLASGARR